MYILNERFSTFSLDIYKQLVKCGEEVYLTKNGYGSMVVMSIEHYSQLVDSLELKLDEADNQAETNTKRMTHEEVFGKLRSRLNG